MLLVLVVMLVGVLGFPLPKTWLMVRAERRCEGDGDVEGGEKDGEFGGRWKDFEDATMGAEGQAFV